MLALLTTGCSSAYYQSEGYAGDDLYGIHNKTKIAQREKAKAEAEKAEAEARRAKWEALMAQAQADDAENRYYGSNDFDDLVADDYESAYERRLRGFESPTYKMPSSYWNLRYSGTFNYLTAYDPAFYNIIVMGDEVWVEPKYITSMFGTWGLATGFAAGYMAGIYGSWYNSWGYGWPYYGWGYGPYWGWGGWYNPWWNHSYWYGGYYPYWRHPHWGHPHYYRPRPNYRLNNNGSIPRNYRSYGTPSRNGSFRFAGVFPPHLLTPFCLASSMAALILPMVSVSLLGMMNEQLYLGSEPFTLCGSKMWTKDARTLPVMTFVAIIGFLSALMGCP